MALELSLDVRCFCVITGASQGIGRSLAIECALKMGPGSFLLLIARNEDGLQKTKSLAETSNVKVAVKSADLSKSGAEEMKKILSDCLKEYDVGQFDLNIIVHNAGSIGDVTLSSIQLDNIDQWQRYYDLNIFYPIALNCVFLKMFEKHEERCAVVNITSLCAMKPFAGLPMYCSVKAAKEMYFKVLAEERPLLKVLNYSPGPVQTAMIDNIIDNTSNPNLKESFTSFRSGKKLLEPEQTAKKFLDLFCKGDYKSGDHIDYYD